MGDDRGEIRRVSAPLWVLLHVLESESCRFSSSAGPSSSVSSLSIRMTAARFRKCPLPRLLCRDTSGV